MSEAKVNKPWDKNLQLLLTAIMAFNVVPHATTVPLWVTLVATSCLIWKTLYLSRGVRFPPRWALWLATAGATIGIFASYSTILGQEPAGALLLVMTSLKLLETNRYRDAMLFIFTSYFLLMAHLLESQSLLSTVYMGIDVLAITTLMFQVHRRDRRSSPRSLKPAWQLIALALPLWVFLFFLFPRFSTGLWNMQSSESSTAFSDNLDPGAISRLIDSDETAFRVEFPDGTAPSPGRMYWRGAILTVGDGLKWSRSHGAPLAPDQLTREKPSAPGPGLGYRVWLETGFQKWLFVLDYPSTFSSSDVQLLGYVRRQPGFIYESTRSVYTRFAYSSRAIQAAPSQLLTDSDLEPYLALPQQLDPRISELAEKLKAETLAARPAANETRSIEERLARRAMNWLSDSGFRYTKEPGALVATEGGAQLAEFLFKTKRGFCEHFAAAFATLMRSMGVPARVVVGFQGATPNDLGGYWIVRRMDAHAWTEIWMRDPTEPSVGRWVRMDPTELIAPLRLQLGGEFYRFDTSALAGLTSDELRQRLNGGIGGAVRRARHAWDVVQMRWNSFLLNYDFEYQAELMRRLGVAGSSRWTMAIAVLLGLAAFAYIFSRVMRRRAHQVDAVLSDWRRFCAVLEKTGLARDRSEGPLAFGERAAAKHPAQAAEIRAIAHAFAQLRYGADTPHDAGPATDRRSFHQSVRRFSIAASSKDAAS